MLLGFNELLKRAKLLPPLRTAVVHPVTAEALSGALESAQQGLITPVLIGPQHKIEKAAQDAQIDISPYEMINVEHSTAAAEHGVNLIHLGAASMLMKGSLHTDEFMQAIIDKDKGLRTGRRMSHVFVVETTTYPKLLLLTDCALNVRPELMAKKDIVQNAIEFALAIGINLPKVAILSAIETITDKIPSTLDAAALCKMADRKQIVGGLLDGPLAFDNAISEQAAAIKDIHSPVAGQADILVAPDLESGNLLAKQLQYLANAKLAGVVLGARVPIVLTSRADDAEARVESCALGILYQHYREHNPQCR